MKVLDMPQGSTAWSQARCGVVTASEADEIMTPLFKVKEGVGVETYKFRKLAEKLLGYVDDSGGTFDMSNGQMAEKIALPWWNFEYDDNVRRVGFCVSDDGRTGCSPDGLCDEYGLEIKFPTNPIHIKYLLNGELPPAYMPQVHFSMFVTGFREWRFLSFSRVLRPLVVRVPRDEKIQSSIRAAVEAFYEKFDSAYAKIKAMRDEDNAIKDAAYNATPRGRD